MVSNFYRWKEAHQYVYVMTVIQLADSCSKVYGKSRGSPEQQEERDSDNTDKSVPHQTLKLTDQYLALLVIILTNAGLCQVRYKINERGEAIPLTHSNPRPLPPCLKNQRLAPIYHAKPRYSWPKSLHWQIGCYR